MLNIIPYGKNQIRRREGGNLLDLHSMIDDFFNDNFFNNSYMTDGFLPSRISGFSNFKIDVKDEGENYLVQAELPGIKKEEISIDYEDGNLMIQVNKEENKDEEKDNYIHKERKICSMRRSIYLPDSDTSNIDASLVDGVLEINIKKKEQNENKVQINIK